MNATFQRFAFPALVLVTLFAIGWGMFREDMANRDEKKSLDRFEISATFTNDRVGARNTGIRYGKQKEYEKSAQFFEKGARMDDSDSYMVLGLYYCLGLGVEQDDTKGAEFLKRAVILGCDQAKKPLSGIQDPGLDAIRKDGSPRRFLDGLLKE